MPGPVRPSYLTGSSGTGPGMLSPEQEHRAAVISGLRQLADYLDERPGVPVPFVDRLNAFAYPDTHPVADMARAMGGFDKGHDGSYLELIRRFDGGVTLVVNYASDQVCEKVVLGVEHVPEKVTPAHDREIVEWKCPPVLLAVDA